MHTYETSLGYEQVYLERLEETQSMITLATLLDFLDQGVDDGINYRSVMEKVRSVAAKAYPSGLPTQTPDAMIVSSVIRSNVKVMLYNIIEYSVTSLIKAIYERIEDDNCSYVEVTEKLRTIWHHTHMRKKLNNPSSNNTTAEHASKELLDHAIASAALHIEVKQTVAGGNLDGSKIRRLFDDHGVAINLTVCDYREDELKDIKDRRNSLAHGSVSFTDAGNQVTTAELDELARHVDSFLWQLREDVVAYLEAGGYRASPDEN